ncbi:MAG: DUF2147 domain-containing protein [Pseudomonadota bacterium]
MPKVFAFVAAIFAVFGPTWLFADADESIVGRYWNPDRDAIVEIYSTDGVVFGRAIWSAEPMLDAENPDPALRSRDLLGVPFITGFRFDGKDRWQDGRVYAPDNGRTYRGTLWVEDGALKMRGFVGISLLGRTATFERLAANEPLPTNGFAMDRPEHPEN